MPRSKDLSHEHDWVPETVDAEWDEDLFITWGCSFAEVTSSQHSARHDETFYGYGAECAAIKTAVYDLHIESVHGDDLPRHDGMYEILWDQHRDAVEAFAGQVNPWDVPRSMVAHYEEIPLDPAYAVVFELDKTYVDEDWA